jgi:hypothetical protein
MIREGTVTGISPPAAAEVNGKKDAVLEMSRGTIVRPNLTKPQITMEYDPLQIHVGNLNWMVSSDHIATELVRIVSTSSMEAAISTATTNDTHTNSPIPVRVQVRDKTQKKRDKDKCHGGSATLVFDNELDARLGMDRLEAFSVASSTATDTDTEASATSTTRIVGDNGTLQVRWAMIKKKTQESDDPTIHVIQEEMLVQHRQQRAEKYARKRRRIAARTDEVIESLQHILPTTNHDDAGAVAGQERNDCGQLPILNVPPIDWDVVPSVIDPMRGGGIRQGSQRGYRKQAQVEAFWHVLTTALLEEEKEAEDSSETSSPTRRITVADLGSGAGNLSLPIAWFLNQTLHRDASVLAVDINGRALERFLNRAHELGISSSVSAAREDLLQLMQAKEEHDTLSACSAIMSLHACGAASDLAIAAAVNRSLPFCVSPCCIGKVNQARQSNRSHMPIISSERSGTPREITYPRSRLLGDENLDPKDYGLILASADYSAPDVNKSENGSSGIDTEHFNRGRLSKLIVETDRLAYAKEHGYSVRMVEIPRMGPLYPKRELLLGAKSGTHAASRISQLSTTSLFAKRDDDDFAEKVTSLEDVPKKTSEGSGGLDAKGFAGYLAPYALALLLSIAVTGAFVKYVLLDY